MANVDVTGMMGKLRLVIILVVFAFLFNNYFLFNIWSGESGENPYITKKIEQPFVPLDTAGDTTGHFGKLAFRFVPFLIAHVIHIDHLGLYLFQILLGIIFPLLIWRALFNATKSMELSTRCTYLVSTLYCGYSFFYDTIFFDSFAYWFLLMAMLSTNRWLTVLMCLCAGFTDQRGLIASTLVLIWHWYISRDLTINGLRNHLAWYIWVILLYASLRLVIGALTGLQTPLTGLGVPNLRANLSNIVLLTWSVFEGGWLVIFYAVYLLIDRKEGVIVWASASCLFLIFLAGLLVGDSIRSQQYAFPLLLIAFVVVGAGFTYQVQHLS